MTALVTCRQCGADFEIDVLHLAGRWWDQCPHCTTHTDAQPESPELSETEEVVTNG